jgi:hypothetical protein
VQHITVFRHFGANLKIYIYLFIRSCAVWDNSAILDARYAGGVVLMRQTLRIKIRKVILNLENTINVYHFG